MRPRRAAASWSIRVGSAADRRADQLARWSREPVGGYELLRLALLGLLVTSSLRGARFRRLRVPLTALIADRSIGAVRQHRLLLRIAGADARGTVLGQEVWDRHAGLGEALRVARPARVGAVGTGVGEPAVAGVVGKLVPPEVDPIAQYLAAGRLAQRIAIELVVVGGRGGVRRGATAGPGRAAQSIRDGEQHRAPTPVVVDAVVADDVVVAAGDDASGAQGHPHRGLHLAALGVVAWIGG